MKVKASIKKRGPNDQIVRRKGPRLVTLTISDFKDGC